MGTIGVHSNLNREYWEEDIGIDGLYRLINDQIGR